MVELPDGYLPFNEAVDHVCELDGCTPDEAIEWLKDLARHDFSIVLAQTGEPFFIADEFGGHRPSRASVPLQELAISTESIRKELDFARPSEHLNSIKDEQPVFDDAWWPTLPAIMWVMTRKPQAVNAVSEPLGLISACNLRDDSYYIPYRQAGRLLINAAGSGKVRSTGICSLAVGSQPIPKEDWSLVEYIATESGSNDGSIPRDGNVISLSRWTKLRFFSADMQNVFPPIGSIDQPASNTPSEADSSSPVMPKVGGKHRGYDDADRTAIEAISALMDEEPTLSRWRAALRLADKLPGYGAPESRAKRITGKMNKLNSGKKN